MKSATMAAGLCTALLVVHVPAFGQEVPLPTELPSNTAGPVPIGESVFEPTVTPDDVRESLPPRWDPYRPSCLPSEPLPAVFPPGSPPPVVFPPSQCVEQILALPPPRAYFVRGFGEFLFLQPRSAADVIYAVPVNGAIVPPPTPPVPVGPAAAVDPSYQPGFRVGLGVVIGPSAEVTAAYTRFESNTSHQFSVDPADVVVIRSLVVHPGMQAADADFLDAGADAGVDFQLVDLDYRLRCDFGPCETLHYLAGVRYARLQQDFDSQFSNTTTIEEVDTRIGFEGGGIRVGVEGQRYARRTGLMVYGRGSASVVAGEFQSAYAQTDNISGTIVFTDWETERVVPILELEAGVGWIGPRGHWRLRAGYTFSAWYNVVKTSEFIRAARSASFLAVDDALTFDGLTARAEFRY